MNKKIMSKGILKDIMIVVIGVVVIWVGLQVAFGTQNPFYVVASGSMIPVLQVYDVLIVQGHEPFEDIQVGDIIVFNRPSGHDRVIVHRVAAIIDDEPKTIRTKGDANPASIPGTDFPITKEEYIGKVAYTIPQIGYVTQLLKPPMNYIIIVIVIGIMVVKQISKKKNEKELSLQDPFNQNDSQIESSVNIPELDKLEKDNVYSKHEESKLSEEPKKYSEDQK
ncbi:MAG: signal peptidase I [Nitrosarchaeum sp.]|nr:signal peptidase I [Nitrosarchaeum sp.]